MRKHAGRYAVVAMILLLATNVTAQVKSSKAQAALETYFEKEHDLAEKYEKAAANLRKKYLALSGQLRADAIKQLDAALKEAVSSGLDDEAAGIREAISRIKDPAAKPGKSSAAVSKAKRHIVFLPNGDDPFWDVCTKGMKDAVKQLKIEEAGLTLVVDKSSEFRTAKQLTKLEQYATRTDIVAVAFTPVDASNRRIAKALNVLRDRGVKVICIDTDMDRAKFRDSRFAYLGTNNFEGGEALGRAAKGLKPDGGKYATFVGLKGVANAIDRISGFAKGAGGKFEGLDSMADHGDENRAQLNVEVVLTKYADKGIDTLVGIWAYNAHAIVKVVEKRDARDQQTIVVFDAAKQALSDMKKGQIDAMVAQNPYQMGQLGMKLLKALVEDDHKSIAEMFKDYDPNKKQFKTKDGDIFDTELRVIVPDEQSPLKKNMFRPETKFFYYNDFKKWLDKHGLDNS
jgi:ribose transport system substrate-binding protein